jgi:hypothetical protein
MTRWLEQLKEYDFSIVHRQGRKHSNADSLSRLPCNQCGRETHTEQLTAAVVTLASDEDLALLQLQLQDEIIGPVLKAKKEGNRPQEAQVKSLSTTTRRLFQLWDQLISCKMTNSTDNSSTQRATSHIYSWWSPGVSRTMYLKKCMKAHSEDTWERRKR